jgi:LytS/YehU family sensor histidine kinase
MYRIFRQQSSHPLFDKAELMIVLLLGLLYFSMAIFGRGTFWVSFEMTNLYFIILAFPLAFLINTYLLLPLLIKKGKWLIYIFSTLTIQILLEVLRSMLTSDETSKLFGNQNTVVSFASGIITSWIFVSLRDWLVHIREIERLKSEKLRSELNFLKIQVDPHFLFNTLNSIYALSLEENSSKTADSIVKLSALMRYNLHDSNEDMISIEKEIDYIEKYIALQKLRLNDNNRVEVIIDYDKPNTKETKIAPLLLIPFIENVFKYGVSPAKETEMSIHILVSKDFVELKTSNDIMQGLHDNTVRNGVGLENVKARLKLLYVKRHELNYGTTGNKYHSHLKIKL